MECNLNILIYDTYLETILEHTSFYGTEIGLVGMGISQIEEFTKNKNSNFQYENNGIFDFAGIY